MKKLLTYVVAIATIVWSLGLGAVVPMAAAAYSPEAGDIIRTADSPAVYYIGADGKRHLFVNRVTYGSWLANFDDLQYVTSDELTDIAPGANVTVRPGTNLIKFQTNTNLYAVAPGGVLHKVSADTAAALYGAGYASRVITIQDGFESNYTVGAELTSSSKLPDGSLVKYEGSEDIYYIEDGEKRPLEGDAFVANNFRDSFVVTIPASMTYDNGESITGEEDALTAVAGSGDGAVSAGSSVTVSLASDTPAAGIAPRAGARVPFTTVNLTAASDGDVVIDSLTVQRQGLAADASISSVAIIDAATNVQIGVNQNLNASSKAVFGNDITVPAGTTKKLIIAANMPDNATYAGQIPQLALVGVETKGSVSVVGSLPVVGNGMTVTNLTLGQATVERGSYQRSTTTDVKVGEEDYIISAYKISADSTESQNVSQIKYYQSGTASLTADLENYALYVDNSTKVNATFTTDGKYLTAEFSNDMVNIASGKSKQLVLKADVIGGSTRTIKMGIYRTTDVIAKGGSFGYARTATYTGTSANTSANPVLTNDQLTISAGTMRIEASNTVPATDVSYGDAQTLGSFKFVVQGEEISIEQLTLTISSTTAGSDTFDNVKLVDEDGTTLWGPSSPSSGSITYTGNANLPVGDNIIDVIADVESTGGFAANETFTFSIAGSSITATGVETDDTITVSPSSAVSTYTQTFKTAKLSITASALPTTGNVSLGAKDVEHASWIFSAVGSGEDVKINSITIGNEAGTGTVDTLSNLRLVNASNNNAIINTSHNGNWYAGTTTWTLSNPLVIEKGKTATIKLLADVTTNSGVTDHANEFIIYGATAPYIAAEGNTTGNDITPTGSGYGSSATSGAVLTLVGAGSLTINTAASNPSARLVAEGQAYEISRLKLTATNEAIDVSNLKVCVGDGGLTSAATGDFNDITTVSIYKSTDMANPIVDSKPMNTICEIIALNEDLTVPVGSSGVELVIKATTATVDNSAITAVGTSNASFKIGLGGTDEITAKGATSGLTVSTITHTASTSSGAILHKAYPSVAINSLSSTKLIASGGVLYDFTVSNPTAEPIALYRLSFHVSTSTDADLALASAGLQAKRSDWSTFKKIADDATPTDVDGAADVYPSFTMIDPDALTAKELVIGAGQSAQFQLIGRSITGLDATLDGSIQIRLLGDTASTTMATSYSTGAPAGAFSALEQGNFVWSDLYESDTSAITTSQWYNGYLVSGLAATSTVSSLTE